MKGLRDARPDLQVFFGVHDNEAATVNGFEKFLGKEGHRCFAHTLQLAVRDALNIEELKPLLRKARRIVSRFRRSVVLMKSLRAQQESLLSLDPPAIPPAPVAPIEVDAPRVDDLGIKDDFEEEVEILEEGSIFPEVVREVHQENLLRRLQDLDVGKVGRKLKLIIDVPTRWNSTLYMIERMLVMKKAINGVIATCGGAFAIDPRFDDPGDEPLTALSQTEWKTLNDLWRLLFHVAEITDRSQGDTYPTLGQSLFDLYTWRKTHHRQIRSHVTQDGCREAGAN
jgi:hypothetical protein